MTLLNYLLIQTASSSAERSLLLYMIGVLFVVSGLIITFFIVFQKRKDKLLLEKMEQQKQFDEELLITQQEIQEETFKQVGRELHDNVGQLLALTSMHLNLAKSGASIETQDKLNNASESLKSSLSEVRALSKSLNSDFIMNTSLIDIIQNEISRLKKLGTIELNFSQNGKFKELNNPKDRLMLFRIIQEFISNSLKYSNANSISIELNYSSSAIDIILKDDGIGFDQSTITKGSGLINMEKRATLIKTSFDLVSQKNHGTQLKLQYPIM